MLLMSSASFAQFSNSSSSSSASTDGWSTIYLQWNPSTLKPDKGDSESFTGLSIGYNKAFSISQSAPIFIEAGLGVQYSFKTISMADRYELDDDDLEYMDPELKYSVLSAKIPVSIAYDFQIPNSNVSITPFAGLDFRFNIIGKQKLEWNFTSEAEEALEYHYGSNWEKEKMYGYSLGGEDWNLFDKDDMGSDDATWNRFQIGWHIGVNARFNNKFLVGLSYGTDFSEIAKKTKINTASITVGYCF